MPKVTFKTIDTADVAGKRVLVRVDLNVPMKNGKVTDATRIERAAPTIAELAAKGARVVVLSHFGRPDGKRVPEMSLRALVEPLSTALGKPVAFAEDCIGPQAEDAVRARCSNRRAPIAITWRTLRASRRTSTTKFSSSRTTSRCRMRRQRRQQRRQRRQLSALPRISR